MCVSGRSRVRGTSVGEWSVQCVCVFEPRVRSLLSRVCSLTASLTVAAAGAAEAAPNERMAGLRLRLRR